jgi:hypothetical protein
MAATKTTKVELLQATDAAGTGAKAITDAEAEVTANTLVHEATVALGSAAATDVVTINGIAFTMAVATSIPDREFADDDGLADCVNDAVYGVPHVRATAATNVATLNSDGEVAITVEKTEVAGTITLATTQAQAYVDIDVGNLDLANDFSHVAAKVTTTATSVVSVSLDFYEARFTPASAVGASAIL